MGSPDCGSDCPHHHLPHTCWLASSRAYLYCTRSLEHADDDDGGVERAVESVVGIGREPRLEPPNPRHDPFHSATVVSDNTRSGFGSHNHEIEKEITEDAAL